MKKVIVAAVSVAIGVLTAGTLAALSQGIANLTLGSVFSGGASFMTGVGGANLSFMTSVGIS